VSSDGAISKRQPVITVSSPSFPLLVSAVPRNDIEIEQRYWPNFDQMLLYISRLLAADGFAPLIGDTDGGQFPCFSNGARTTTDIFWKSARRIQRSTLREPEPDRKRFRTPALHHAATTISICVSTRAARASTDAVRMDTTIALSIEVSAGGVAFIVDPGTYVYTGDLQNAHEFRSTAYHSLCRSTASNRTRSSATAPFVIGNEARPRACMGN
jgi:hypothetical protein